MTSENCTFCGLHLAKKDHVISYSSCGWSYDLFAEKKRRLEPIKEPKNAEEGNK